MKCSRCQHEAPADAGFCPQCGAKLAGVCARCGAENASDHKFCVRCGQPLTAAPAQARDAGRFGSPLTYTPKHLTEKILTSKSALEGERKQVTVLFCDIVESTRLAEGLDPEVMHRLMDETLQLMAEAIHRYQGTVNQFLGDGVMALFGAPAAVEDHALRGVQAALAIRETLNSYSERLKRERSLEIQLRMGLNTGLVVVGRIGDDLRMDYTAIGDTTHLAARMQTLAEPGTILITEATHRLVAGYVEAEALGPVAVRGRSEPIEVYRLVARRRATSRLELSAERGLTPLVGREPELGVMHDRLARARAGHGQVIGIVGEPGAGKSRVLYEFRKSLEAERLTWLAGHCVAYGQTTPYLPVLEILKAAFEIEDGDNPLQIQDKLRQGLRALDPGLDAALPFLRELFGLPVEDDRVRELEPKDKRQRIFEAVRALLAAESQRRPMVVIVEDLHWIDRTSEDLIGFLIDSVPAMSLLVLMTHRPGYTVRSADRTYYTQIALDLLNESQAEAMIAGLLESRQLPSDVLSVILEKTDGNPLFVEEITRSLSERRLLVRRGGGVEWTRDAPVEIPMSVQDIVRARVDGLEDPIKRTVQTAAVIGREFGLRLLAGVAEQRANLDHHLDILTHLELVHEKRVFPEVEYMFKHAVTQEVVYETLLVQRRKELHRRIGQGIEELYAGRVEEQAAILAHHYTRGEDRDKMVQYAVLAGDRAGRLYANADARSYYQQALAIVRTPPAPAEGQRAEIDIAVKLAGVGMSRQDIEQDLENLERARGLAEALDDAPRLARVLYWLGRLHYMLGASHETAIDYATRSLEIADRLGDETLAAPSVNLIGRVYWNQTDLIRASVMLERSVGQMISLGNKTEAATAAGAAAFVFGCMGEFDRAMRYADRGVELAREARDPSAEAAAWQNRAFVLEHRGELTRALREYAEARRIAEQVGDRFRVYIINVLEIRSHLFAGDPRGAQVVFEAAQAFAEQIRTNFLLPSLKMGQATCLLALGDAAAALEPCREAIRRAEQSGEKFIRALAGRVLAEVSVALDPSPPGLVTAVASLEESIALLEDIGARPEQARCYVDLARLVRLQGDLERADELVRRARALFGVMDLQWDLNRLDEASADPPPA